MYACGHSIFSLFTVLYERLKSKKGSGKAIIATARKLLGMIYMLLSEDLMFEVDLELFS